MTLLDQAKHIPNGIAVISKWLGSGGEVVDARVAQARANICNFGAADGKRCINNDMGIHLATTVALTVKQYLEIKNKLGLKVVGEKGLGTCSMCGCSLRLKVHEPQERVRAELTDEEKLTAPDFCWQIK